MVPLDLSTRSELIALFRISISPLKTISEAPPLFFLFRLATVWFMLFLFRTSGWDFIIHLNRMD